MSSIFLSYCHKDNYFVRKLAKDLRKAGHYVWTDSEIKVGDSLIEKIRGVIDKVNYLGAIISKNSIKSQWVRKEIDVAINQEISGERMKVIPILLHNVRLPGFLEGKKFADFRKKNLYRESLKEIKKRLGNVLVNNQFIISPKEAKVLLKRLEILKELIPISNYEREKLLRKLTFKRKSIRSKHLALEIKVNKKVFSPQFKEVNHNFAFLCEGISYAVCCVLHILRAKRRKTKFKEMISFIANFDKISNFYLLVEATLRRLQRLAENNDVTNF